METNTIYIILFRYLHNRFEICLHRDRTGKYFLPNGLKNPHITWDHAAQEVIYQQTGYIVESECYFLSPSRVGKGSFDRGKYFAFEITENTHQIARHNIIWLEINNAMPLLSTIEEQTVLSNLLTH